MNTSIQNQVAIKKTDEQLQVVYGEVYAPGVLDVHNEFMNADGIREMAYKFMLSNRMGNVDTNHDNEINDSYVCESFIARKDDTDFIEGSWVVGVKCPDDVWQSILKGDLNGFSMEALVQKEETELEVDIPDVIKGGTDTQAGHYHSFKADFDDAGQLTGGITDECDGHVHIIKYPTHTEEANGHTHRFSFVEYFTNG